MYIVWPRSAHRNIKQFVFAPGEQPVHKFVLNIDCRIRIKSFLVAVCGDPLVDLIRIKGVAVRGNQRGLYT